MARTVNEEKIAAKRKEILAATQRLIFTKGYEQMSVQDILKEVWMSNGAFHHYFRSRSELLAAYIEQTKQESGKLLLPVVRDPHLTALQKLQGIFDTLDQFRTVHKAELARLLQVWYKDENATVRLKVEEALFETRAPLIAEIIRQGIQEGVFTNPDPDKAGEVIMSLLQGMENTHARLMLLIAQEKDNEALVHDAITNIVATHEAYMDALERVLGTRPHSLYRAKAETVQSMWVSSLREDS